jgi:hypothetical protein
MTLLRIRVNSVGCSHRASLGKGWSFDYGGDLSEKYLSYFFDSQGNVTTDELTIEGVTWTQRGGDTPCSPCPPTAENADGPPRAPGRRR